MPVDNKTSTVKEWMQWGTYGAVANNSDFYDKSVKNRARNWTHGPHRTRAAMYAELLRVGYLPTLPYVDNLLFTDRGMVSASGPISGGYTWDVSWAFGPMNSPFVSVLDSTIGSLELEAITKLQGKTADTKFDVGVTTAELNKTIDMIAGFVQRTAGAYRDVKRGNYRRAASAMGIPTSLKVPQKAKAARMSGKTPDEVWLEYRYGWRLLVMDINGALQTFYDLCQERPQVTKTSVFVESNTTFTRYGSFIVQPPGGPRFCTINYKEEVTLKYAVTMGYRYQVTQPGLATGTKLGLTNLPLLAWELIPWSFVIDHIVNVGDALQGLTAFAGKVYLDGYVTKAAESKSKFSFVSYAADQGYYVNNAYWTGPTPSERHFTRDALSGFQPVVPRFQLEGNFTHLIDAIALIRGVERKALR